MDGSLFYHDMIYSEDKYSKNKLKYLNKLLAF